MTVKELKEALATMPDDDLLAIEYYCDEYDQHEEIKRLVPDELIDYGQYTGTQKGWAYITLRVMNDD